MAKKKVAKKKAVKVAQKKVAKKNVVKTKKVPRARKLTKRKKTTGHREQGYVCGICGKHHPELPMDFAAVTPDPYLDIPARQRKARCHLSSDLCVIDGKEFFVRGCLEIPVVDGPRPFVWGVWASLSRTKFNRVIELWDDDGREKEPPYSGRLCTSLSCYPETLGLKTHVHLRSGNDRPLIELEPTDHPLAVEQRNGITMARAREMAVTLLHGEEE